MNASGLQDIKSLLLKFNSLTTLTLGGKWDTPNVIDLYYTLNIDNLNLDLNKCYGIDTQLIKEVLGANNVTYNFKQE